METHIDVDSREGFDAAEFEAWLDSVDAGWIEDFDANHIDNE